MGNNIGSLPFNSSKHQQSPDSLFFHTLVFTNSSLSAHAYELAQNKELCQCFVTFLYSFDWTNELFKKFPSSPVYYPNQQSEDIVYQLYGDNFFIVPVSFKLKLCERKQNVCASEIEDDPEDNSGTPPPKLTLLTRLASVMIPARKLLALQTFQIADIYHQEGFVYLLIAMIVPLFFRSHVYHHFLSQQRIQRNLLSANTSPRSEIVLDGLAPLPTDSDKQHLQSPHQRKRSSVSTDCSSFDVHLTSKSSNNHFQPSFSFPVREEELTGDEQRVLNPNVSQKPSPTFTSTIRSSIFAPSNKRKTFSFAHIPTMLTSLQWKSFAASGKSRSKIFPSFGNPEEEENSIPFSGQKRNSISRMSNASLNEDCSSFSSRVNQPIQLLQQEIRQILPTDAPLPSTDEVVAPVSSGEGTVKESMPKHQWEFLLMIDDCLQRRFPSSVLPSSVMDLQSNNSNNALQIALNHSLHPPTGTTTNNQGTSPKETPHRHNSADWSVHSLHSQNSSGKHSSALSHHLHHHNLHHITHQSRHSSSTSMDLNNNGATKVVPEPPRPNYTSAKLLHNLLQKEHSLWIQSILQFLDHLPVSITVSLAYPFAGNGEISSQLFNQVTNNANNNLQGHPLSGISSTVKGSFWSRRSTSSASSNIDFSRQESFPLVYVNDAFHKLTGYLDKQEVLGRNPRFLQSEECTEMSQVGRMRDALREMLSCKVCLTNKRKNGSLFKNLVALQPLLNKQGDFIAVLGLHCAVPNEEDEENQKDTENNDEEEDKSSDNSANLNSLRANTEVLSNRDTTFHMKSLRNSPSSSNRSSHSPTTPTSPHSISHHSHHGHQPISQHSNVSDVHRQALHQQYYHQNERQKVAYTQSARSAQWRVMTEKLELIDDLMHILPNILV